MAYYLIITFLFSIFINYKYIYSFVDSNFLYTTSGSKLNKAINKVEKFHFIKIEDKLDISIFIISFLIIFTLNYTISSIIINSNPLNITVVKQINLKQIFQGYELKFKIIYNISMGLSISFVLNDNIHRLRRLVSNKIKKIVELEELGKKQEKLGYLLGKDENDECFYINEDSLYKNVLITGSIGSGKTSGAIARITYNLIKSGKGGLILDVKGNFVDTVKKMCETSGRIADLNIISKNSNTYFELLDTSINSLELASRLKQVITLLSVTNNSDAYWLDKVENVLMNIIIIMKYMNRVDLMTLHRLISQDEYLKASILEIKNRIKQEIPDDKTSFELAGAITFIENEYFKLDNRVNSIIKSEITRLTIPLITDYEIYNQFCVQGSKNKLTFDSNKIVVLSINIGENRALAKIIATFLKLSFQKYILSRFNSKHSSFFIADEFQEFCNIEDAHFLSLSREAKCINVISTQSYTSLKNSLKDQNAASVIIQNLVNKIWFRNDDMYTISETIKQLGKINVTKENRTVSESSQESKNSIFTNELMNKKSSISKSLNYVLVKENEYDENYFTRELKTFESLVFISTNEEIITNKVIFERWK